MSTFVPGGQAGEESVRTTREDALKARQRGEARESGQAKRPSGIKRLLLKLRRAV